LILQATLSLALAGSPALAQATPETEYGTAGFTLKPLASPERVVGPAAGEPLSGVDLSRRTQEVTDKLRCPVCQGLSVADSPTATAVAMKHQAEQMLATGFSEAQVLGYFEQSYGEFVRLAPKAEGFNLVVWIAPILVLVAGMAIVARRLGHRGALSVRTGETASTERTEEVSPELQQYLDRIRQEVRK
jgi:cytochrome c-type biogenesis protein CcmH